MASLERESRCTATTRSAGAATTGIDRLDRNGNNRLDGNDGFSTQPGDVFIGVSADRDSLTITLGDDDIDFLNVSSIARADWA